MWRWVGGALDKVLKQITLADLIGGPRTVGTALNGISTPLTPALQELE